MKTNRDPIAYFITWTTYGSWLPGDARGWRKQQDGNKDPQPLLYDWCRDKMTGEQVLLRDVHQRAVEHVIVAHCKIREWLLHELAIRTNHVHVVVEACHHTPEQVWNQLKANATRVLRNCEVPIVVSKTWTRGGDCKLIFDEEQLDTVCQYVREAQDLKHKEL